MFLDAKIITNMHCSLPSLQVDVRIVGAKHWQSNYGFGSGGVVTRGQQRAPCHRNARQRTSPAGCCRLCCVSDGDGRSQKYTQCNAMTKPQYTSRKVPHACWRPSLLIEHQTHLSDSTSIHLKQSTSHMLGCMLFRCVVQAVVIFAHLVQLGHVLFNCVRCVTVLLRSQLTFVPLRCVAILLRSPTTNIV